AGAINVERSQGAVAERRFKRLWHANAPGSLFLLPWLIGFFGLPLGPALISLYLSFPDFAMPPSQRWVGMANYVRIATA
ncbi:ABC transporter permease, partial [Rhizobium leguminosarum]